MEAEKDLRLSEQSLGVNQEMMTVKEAGRRGGLTTLAKHGVSHFRRAGAIGGRTTAIRDRNKLKEWGSMDSNSKTYLEKRAQKMGADEQFGGKQPNATFESQLTSSTIKVTAQQQSGRKGGLSTVNRYGRAHMSYIGSLGGRPTFEEGLVVPAGVKIVGQWGSLAGHRTFRLTEGEDPKAFLAATMAWTDLGKLETYPVMPSEEIYKILAAKK